MNYYSANLGATPTAHAERSGWLVWSLLLFGIFVITMNFDLNPAPIVDDRLGDDDGGPFTPFRSMAVFGLGVLGLIALLRGKREIGVYSPTGLIALAFLATACMSFLWADDMIATVRRAVTLSFVCLAAFGFARLFSLRDFQKFILLTGFLILGLAVLVELRAGNFLVSRFGGMTNANTQATLTAILLITILSYGWQHWSRAMTIALALIALVLLFLTGSRGGLAAAIIGVIIWRLLENRRPGLLLGQLALAGFIAIPIMAMFIDVSAVVESVIVMGRQDVDAADTTSLTGRFPLWTFLIQNYVPERPLLGFGLGGFWDRTHIREVSNTQDWQIVFAHSAYVDVLLELGIVGVTAFALTLIGAIIRSVKLSHHPEWAAGAAILAALVVNSVVETVILPPTLASFIALTYVAKALFIDPTVEAKSEAEQPDTEYQAVSS